MTYEERLIKNRDKKRRNKEMGLCSCGKPLIEGKKHCEVCRDKKLKYRKSLIINKLCSYGCGNPPEEGKRKCRACLDKKLEHDQRLKNKNLCVNGCGNPPEEGKFRCKKCASVHAAGTKRKKERYKKMGRCIDCGLPLLDNMGRQHCINCVEKEFNFKWK